MSETQKTAVIFGLARRPVRLPARFWAGLATGASLLIPFVIWNFRYGWPVLGIRLGHKTVHHLPGPGAFVEACGRDRALEQ